MTKYRLLQFKREDLNIFQAPPGYMEYLMKASGPGVVDAWLKDGLGFTLFYCKTPIAIGGVMLPWRGMGEAWFIPSIYAEKHKFALHKIAGKFLVSAAKTLRLDRIQASVLADSKRDLRWASLLGFEFEGTMKKYYDGKDFYRLAILF